MVHELGSLLIHKPLHTELTEEMTKKQQLKRLFLGLQKQKREAQIAMARRCATITCHIA